MMICCSCRKTIPDIFCICPLCHKPSQKGLFYRVAPPGQRQKYPNAFLPYLYRFGALLFFAWLLGLGDIGLSGAVHIVMVFILMHMFLGPFAKR